jgi:hypothetical protein
MKQEQLLHQSIRPAPKQSNQTSQTAYEINTKIVHGFERNNTMPQNRALNPFEITNRESTTYLNQELTPKYKPIPIIIHPVRLKNPKNTQ